MGLLEGSEWRGSGAGAVEYSRFSMRFAVGLSRFVRFRLFDSFFVDCIQFRFLCNFVFVLSLFCDASDCAVS